MKQPHAPKSIAVLISGGLDSAVLLGDLVCRNEFVYPLYIYTGSAWEGVEQKYLRRFLNAIQRQSLQPLVTLNQPMRDVYGDHWSGTGQAPDALAPDEDFYLPGRNVILLSKALIWCRLHQVETLVLGVLKANPFPDATPEFFRDFPAVVNRAVGGHTMVETPYANLAKAEVVRIGRDMPLQHTLSCMSPVEERHCGRCGKCAERGRAFLAANVPDPTDYASRAWEGTTQRTAAARPWE